MMAPEVRQRSASATITLIEINRVEITIGSNTGKLHNSLARIEATGFQGRQKKKVGRTVSIYAPQKIC